MSSTRLCSGCRAEVPAGDQFCTACGKASTFRRPAAVTQVLATPAPAGAHQSSDHPQPINSVGTTTVGADTGMGDIALAHGEVVKRVYDLGQIQRAWGWVQGTLVVTDARVLYRAEASNSLNKSTLNKEIHLEDVRGVGLATRRGMSAAGLGSWLLGSAISFVAFLLIGYAISAVNSSNSGSSGWLVSLLFIWLLLCIVIFLIRRRASVVVLTLFSSDTDSSPISVTGVVGNSGGHGFLALFAGPLVLLLERLGIMEADAAAESAKIEAVRRVYAELGAVILDLQSRGSLGGN